MPVEARSSTRAASLIVAQKLSECCPANYFPTSSLYHENFPKLTTTFPVPGSNSWTTLTSEPPKPPSQTANPFPRPHQSKVSLHTPLNAFRRQLYILISHIPDLPRCHVQSKSPKPSNCGTLAASRLSNLSKEKLNPPPFKRSAPSNSTIIAARDVSGDNSTSTNSTTHLSTLRKPALAKKSVNVLPRWYKHRAVRSNAAVPANVTVPELSNRTVGVNGTEVAGAKKMLLARVMEAPNATFPNGTEASNGTVLYERKPRAPRRAPVTL